MQYAFDRWQKDESCHLVLDYEDFVSRIKSGPQTYSELLRPDDEIKPVVDVDLSANRRLRKVRLVRHRHVRLARHVLYLA